VERVEEVFKIALLDYDENQKSIQQILRREISKMIKIQKKGVKKKVAKKRQGMKDER